jgi:hypothetical protein
VNVAKFDLNSKGNGANLGIGAVTFTSTVGLPPALVSSVTATGALNDATLFRLYDTDNAVAVPATRFLNVANGTIAFSGITPAAFPAVTYGQTRHLALQITTTNQALWPANTSLLFTAQPGAATIMPITVGQIATGVTANDTDFSLLQGANTLFVPQVTDATGSIMQTTGGDGAPFVDGTYELLLLGPNAAAVVAIGDFRLVIGLDAARGLGYTPGSIVAAGDTDIGTAHNAVQVTDAAGSIFKTGGANGNPAVYGTNGVYRKVTAVGGNAFNLDATDVRVAPGNTLGGGINWQGGAGFGGSLYSIPANANTVTIGQ